ncbi:hypothetical protein CAEBREN_16853 [Caenorhabditis brenneri]|uniref:Decapping nuclease n=1 Tax=Caenorhabditis brenneri TaxID=135651 RepID=G0NJ28_CAEBE|nr:hypothetical protein CAEBREN_16853 [Caenorhabditis brenneri]
MKTKVTIDVETVGTKIILNDLPPRLNESNHLYGSLKEELDLTVGSSGFDDFDNENGFDSLCDYILENRKKGESLKETINADFIATPRILNALARSAPLEIQAIRHHDVIFLFDKASNSENVDTSIPCLEKFKQYMTLDKNGEPRGELNEKTTKVVNRITLNSEESSNFKVFYSSKIDAIDENGQFLELKTTTLGHKKWIEKQSLRHYLQSFLANVPYAIYGRRPNIQEQVVQKVDRIPTGSIPNYPVKWNKDTCFSQLFDILQKIYLNLEFEEEPIIVKVTKEGVSCEASDEYSELVNPLFLRHFE